MPRSLWTGSLSFGLVNVPVELLTAARDLDYHFHQLHERDNTPIEQRRYCSKEGVEVDWEEIAYSYELADGRRVLVTDDELAAAEPRKTRTIDIESFVDLAEVDPIYFDHPYFLAPAGDSEGALRAYRLLVDVIDQTDRAALGRFVMRTKEYLVIVRVRDGALALTTMLFHDEVRSTEPIPTGGRNPEDAALDRAVSLIDALSTDWDPERYEDRYRARLQRIIESKQEGRRVRAPMPEKEPAAVPDLMEALIQSLEEADGRDRGTSRAGRAR